MEEEIKGLKVAVNQLDSRVSILHRRNKEMKEEMEETKEKWEMLKDYLGVEETEEAKIEVDTNFFDSADGKLGELCGVEVFSFEEVPTKAVKVKKLEKIKKKRKK